MGGADVIAQREDEDHGNELELEEYSQTVLVASLVCARVVVDMITIVTMLVLRLVFPVQSEHGLVMMVVLNSVVMDVSSDEA